MDRIAAIDIGSNAIRVSIAEVDKKWRYKVIYKHRIPIRLGREAFGEGYFSEYTINKTVEAFQDIRVTFDEYEVDFIRAIATSAMRESRNRKILCKQIYNKTGIVVHVIDGFHEAKLIFKAIKKNTNIRDGKVLLMDLGGGSLEITGVNNGRFIECHTFKLGTIRLLQIEEKTPDQIEAYIQREMAKVKRFLKSWYGGELSEIRLVATGGNCRRMGKLREQLFDRNSNLRICRKEVFKLYNEMKPLTPSGRVREFGLSIDRADVILPALHVMLLLTEITESEKVELPRAGLIHGVFEDILQTEMDFKD
jgi:exopolyphosphatase/guanosine-5'-triphosphate,3'-diphosphate pyrophosphatase